MKLRELVSFEHPLSAVIFAGITYFSIITLGVVKRCTYKPITEITKIYGIKQNDQTYSQPYIVYVRKGKKQREIRKNAELIRKFETTYNTYPEWVNRHNPMINFLSTLKKGIKKADSAR